MDIQLITKADFLPFRAISANIDSAQRLEPQIEEAQRIDLFDALGEVLFYDLMTNIAAVNAATVLDPDYIPNPGQLPFVQLLNGLKYNVTVKLDGTDHVVNKDYPGLKPYLVYMSYRRFVNRDNIRSTPSGFVTKNTMESTPVSGKQISEEAARAEQDALRFLSFAETFMKDKKDFFGKYLKGGCDSSLGHTGLSGIGAPRNRNGRSRNFSRNDR